jgi:hypothetical protein
MLENPSTNKKKFDRAKNRLDKVENSLDKNEPEDKCFATRKKTHLADQ